MMDQSLRTIGRYEIIERVGRGGMGALYRARDTVLDRQVAVKVMNAEFAGDDVARTRFFREAKSAARLQHRNIVTMFECGEQDDTPFIAMEFLRGRSLAERLRQEPPLTLDEKLDIAIQLCSGLEFAHSQGVIHRDVKPANVWLCDDGGVKLLDFGIAKSGGTTITAFGSVMGSPYYMSPEQIAGRDLDGRSDVFSAGVMVYELLSGRKPFEAETPTAVMLKISNGEFENLSACMPEVSAELAQVIDRALQHDPEQRYRRAADFGADLQLVRLTLDVASSPQAILAETIYAPAVSSHTPGVGSQVLLERSASIPVGPPARPGRGLVHGAVAVGTLVVLAVVVPVAMRWNRLAQRPSSSGPAVVTPQISVPPTPKTVPLAVISEPAGAAILLDGQATAQVTPAKFRIDPAHRPARIRLTKSGFEAAEADITPTALEQGRISIALSPVHEQSVSATFSGPYAFELVEGQHVVSRKATVHHLTITGRRTVRMRASDVLLDRAVTVDARNGRPVDVRAPGVGQLAVVTSPALEMCTIWAESVSLGSPPTDPQQIVEGTHAITVKCPSGQNRRVEVNIIAGELRREVIR